MLKHCQRLAAPTSLRQLNSLSGDYWWSNSNFKKKLKKKDAQQPQINEIQSSSSFLSAEIESAIASVMGQDQAIARTPENIAKAQAYLK